MIYSPQTAPNNNALKISRLNVSGLNDLNGVKKENKESKESGLTSQKSSDNEVSFSLPKFGIPNFWELCKRINLLFFVRDECLYSAMGAVTCLVTFPTFVEVRGFTLTALNRYRS